MTEEKDEKEEEEESEDKEGDGKELSCTINHLVIKLHDKIQSTFSKIDNFKIGTTLVK